ncbi:MAG: hypothetical protein ABII18_04095 [bacterium]
MIDKPLKILKTIYPFVEQPKIEVLGALKNLPMWILGSVKVYVVFLEDNDLNINFVQLSKDLTFGQVTLIYKKLTEQLNGFIIMIADNMPAKYRGLLVRSRISYVFKDQSIYAPDLGLHINNAKKHFASKPEIKQTEALLTPFALKLIAGIITEHLPKDFTLKGLLRILHQKTVKASVAKLSMTLNLLVQNNLILSKGSGPQKSFIARTNQEMFDVLNELRIAPLYKTYEYSHSPFVTEKSCRAGETALAQYSMLAEPRISVIAVMAKEFREQKQLDGQIVDEENPCHVQVWKEDPMLFSQNKNLNPVELYLSIKDDPDERVQLSLVEMLKGISLKKESE